MKGRKLRDISVGGDAETFKNVGDATLGHLLPEMRPGAVQADGSVYLGFYKPKDSWGRPLGKIFNVYAAPEDLPEAASYEKTVKKIGALKNWHGHDGEEYANEYMLRQALEKGAYMGGWVIPALEILLGRNEESDDALAANMRAHKDKGAFKDTFKAAAWYWSSSYDREYVSNIWACRIDNGHNNTCSKTYEQLHCRPVRLVPFTP